MHPDTIDIDMLCVNTIRTLAMDAVQAANSGHPGAPMALAPVMVCLWKRFLRYDPEDALWPNRDRFVLSAGHASMLLYATLHLAGVRATEKPTGSEAKLAVSLEDLKEFRQLGSRCPGHPEYRVTTGVETTTGPLGQGAANSVGMAMASRWLAAYFNRPGFDLFGFDVYTVCSDGDMMEGIASEAASLAGHLRLSNLCWVYDRNRITLDGKAEGTFTEDVSMRFAAYGWKTVHVSDVNDLGLLQDAFETFRRTTDQPTLVIVDSHIGYGSPGRQDSSEAHGAPLGDKEVRLSKEFYGWPPDEKFLVPEQARRTLFDAMVERSRPVRDAWTKTMDRYREVHPELFSMLSCMLAGQVPSGWDKDLPSFAPDAKGAATRVSSGKVLDSIAKNVPWLLGGAADLSSSTKTVIKSGGNMPYDVEHPAGRNVSFGVREHAMGAIANGLSLCGLRPFASTFLVFTTYMQMPIRLSALMRLPVVFIFTHDSVFLGEDGPTHQPVEQLTHLRSIPGLITLRPADANEVVEAWRVIMESEEPVALVLSRQDVPTLDRSLCTPAAGVRKGGYVLSDAVGKDADIILVASGSEVSLCVEAADKLLNQGIQARVVSMPSWEIFDRQGEAYRESVLPSSIEARVSVEASSPMGWERYVGTSGTIVGMRSFGASAPQAALQKHFGFTTEAIVEAAKNQLQLIRH